MPDEDVEAHEDLFGAEEIPVITTAYDMKALTILVCCDIMKQFYEMGNVNAAYAIQVLIETLELIQVEGEPREDQNNG